MRNDQLYLLAGALHAQGNFVEEYRDEYGNKCIIGMLIEDGVYHSAIENNCASYVLERFKDVADSIKKYQGSMSDADFAQYLNELQEYNDSKVHTSIDFNGVYQDLCEIRSKYPY